MAHSAILQRGYGRGEAHSRTLPGVSLRRGGRAEPGWVHANAPLRDSSRRVVH